MNGGNVSWSWALALRDPLGLAATPPARELECTQGNGYPAAAKSRAAGAGDGTSHAPILDHQADRDDRPGRVILCVVVFFGYQGFFRHTLNPWSTAGQILWSGREYRGGQEVSLDPALVRSTGALAGP